MCGCLRREKRFFMEGRQKECMADDSLEQKESWQTMAAVVGVFLLVLITSLYVQQKDAIMLPLLLASTVALGSWLFMYGRKRTNDSISVAEMEATSADSIQSGRVKVCGTAKEAGGVLASPLSRQDCFMYRYEAREYSEGTEQEVIDAEQRSLPFTLVGEEGEVRVHPEKARLQIRPDDVATVKPGDEPSLRVKKMLDRRGETASDEKRVCYMERCLSPGEQVCVVGMARSEAEGVVIEGGDEVIVYDPSESDVITLPDRRMRAVMWTGVVMVLTGIAGCVWQFLV